MALLGPNAETAASKTPFFDVERLCASTTNGASSYRCQGCGEEVAFDSLAASCRCIDECYWDIRSEPNSRFI